MDGMCRVERKAGYVAGRRTGRSAGRCAGRTRRGFSLVEVLIGIIILALAVIPVLDVLLHGFKDQAASANTMVAVNLAMCKLNEIRHTDYHELAALPDTFDWPDLPFEGTMALQTHPDAAGKTKDEKSGEVAEVQVKITWFDEKMKKDQSVTLSTLVAKQ